MTDYELRSSEPSAGAAFTQTRNGQVVGYIQQTTDCEHIQAGYSDDENTIKRFVGMLEGHQPGYKACMWVQGLNGARAVFDRRGMLDLLAFILEIVGSNQGEPTIVDEDRPLLLAERIYPDSSTG